MGLDFNHIYHFHAILHTMFWLVFALQKSLWNFYFCDDSFLGLSWNFEKFYTVHVNQIVHCNQIWLECYDSRWWSGFYDQNKKVSFLKNIWSVPCTMDSSYFSQKMATWCPNFPHTWLCSRIWFFGMFHIFNNQN